MRPWDNATKDAGPCHLLDGVQAQAGTGPCVDCERQIRNSERVQVAPGGGGASGRARLCEFTRRSLDCHRAAHAADWAGGYLRVTDKSDLNLLRLSQNCNKKTGFSRGDFGPWLRPRLTGVSP